LEALRRNNLRVIGLAEMSPELAVQKAQELGIPRSYPSYEAMLADPEIDVVHLATPNYLQPGGNNLASAPAIWKKMWEIIPDDNFGLNLDPSHLVMQMIDDERVVREFSAKIFHVHAKDLQIDHEGLYQNGVFSQGMGWQIPRLPGLGDMNWGHFISALYRAGYNNVIARTSNKKERIAPLESSYESICGCRPGWDQYQSRDRRCGYRRTAVSPVQADPGARRA
jgi:hypothetical protein